MQAEPREMLALWLREPPGKAGGRWGGSALRRPPRARGLGSRTPHSWSQPLHPAQGLAHRGPSTEPYDVGGTGSTHSSRVSDWRDFGGPGGELGLHQGRILPPGRQELRTVLGKSSGAQAWALQPWSR